MSKDRLAEFRNQPDYSGQSRGSPGRQLSAPTRTTSSSPPRRAGSSSFFESTQSIKQTIENVRENVKNLQQMHRRAIVEVQTAQSENLKQQIARLTDETADMINGCRSQIKSVAKIPGEDAKVKDNQQKQLAKRLMDVATEFQSVQQHAKRGYKMQMERQYKIARPGASQQEVDRALENPNGYVFQQEIMSSRVGEQRRLLEDVRARNNQIIQIEQSINELFQMFQEMQLLIDNQQGLVDSIDQHVDNTVSHLEQGSKELTSAIAHAKSARKKKMILTIIIVILLAIGGFLAYWYGIKPLIESNNNNKNNNNTSGK